MLRKSILEKRPEIEDIFLKVIDASTAGSPMDEDIKWTNLSQANIALKLKEKGFKVVVTDIKPIPIEDVEFYIDDVTAPKLEIYSDSSLIYSIRPPPEIVPYILRVAKTVNADVLIRPFGNEFYSGRLINYKNERFYVWRDGVDI